MTRNKVFISYSHKDQGMFEKLKTMLAPLTKRGGLLVWDDTKIKAGALWRQEIDTALSEAAVAVMLVSPSFLDSDFISEVELPNLLKAAEARQLKVCWILISDCLYTAIPYLSEIQSAYSPKCPLDQLTKAKLNSALVEIAGVISEQYKSVAGEKQEVAVPESVPVAPVKIPQPAAHVFLSYHSGDVENAKQIRDALQNAGIPIWRDQESIQAGAQFSMEIEQAIRRAAMVVTLITQAATKSTWVRNEILFALGAQKDIIPLLMEPGVQPPIEIIGTQNINMAEDWNGGLERLLKRIQFLLQNVKVESAKSVTEPAVIQPSQPKHNPFIFGNAVPAELFVERKAALDAIAERVGNYYSLQSISIVANRRMGKTSLLNYIWKKPDLVFAPDYDYATIYVDAMDARTHSIAGFMRILRKSLESQFGKSPWRECDDGTLTMFSEAIQELADEGGKRIVLLLDEFESVMAYQELDILLDTLRSCGSQSRIGMVVSTAHELSKLEMEGKLVSVFSNIFQTHYLGNFSESECSSLVERAFSRGGQPADKHDAEVIGTLSGRHPYLVQLAGSIIWKARQGHLGDQVIEEEFKQKARDIFAGILQRLTPDQLAVVKQLGGMAPPEKIPESVLSSLRLRGVLNESDSLFSRCFEAYVCEELR